MSDLELRAGDDDRQATIDRLVTHFRAGRLDAEELEERTAAANAARTHGDLAALEADLPEAGAAPEAAALAERRRRRERVVQALSVSAFLWLIWLLTDPGGFPWPAFPMGAMLVGLVVDFWGGGDEDEERDAGGLPAPPAPPRPPKPPRLP